MRCDLEEISRTIHSPNASAQIFLTVSCVAFFIGTRTIFNTIRRGLAQITVVVIGAGPVGLTAALIAVRDYKRVAKIILYEEQSKYNVEHRPYQISIQPSVVAFLNKNGIDFDNLEGIWHEGCFYTRVGIYLEYIISILPLYKTDIELKFNTKFNQASTNGIDDIPGRVLVICCDGSNGQASCALGISDECIQHSSGIYGAVAALERNNQTLVPTPEKRIRNLTFDLSAYGNCSYDEDGTSNFTMKIFGNSKCRYIALAVNKCESKVVKALKNILDKSMMRNIFLKCFNTYKSSDEPSISDSYCLNNMKFSPRLFEIKLSQRMESVAYIADCDVFVITEGEASRYYNFNTGMDVNVGLKGLTSLQPFIEKVTIADTEHSIMTALIYKMEHSEKICKDFLRHGLKEYLFL